MQRENSTQPPGTGMPFTSQYFPTHRCQHFLPKPLIAPLNNHKLGHTPPQPGHEYSKGLKPP